MTEKVAHRLRAHHSVAQQFYIGIKLTTGWVGGIHKTILPTDDGVIIFRLAKLLIEQSWHGERVYQCQVTALAPQPGAGQADFFMGVSDGADHVNQVMDAINDKFGHASVVRSPCLHKLHSPDVISPAWRPKESRGNKRGNIGEN